MAITIIIFFMINGVGRKMAEMLLFFINVSLFVDSFVKKWLKILLVSTTLSRERKKLGWRVTNPWDENLKW